MTDRPIDTPDEHLACADAVELMTDYLDGALPPAQAGRLERHLEACPGCTEFLDQMRAIAGSLGGLSEASIPAGMRDDLIAAFRDLRNA